MFYPVKIVLRKNDEIFQVLAERDRIVYVQQFYEKDPTKVRLRFRRCQDDSEVEAYIKESLTKGQNQGFWPDVRYEPLAPPVPAPVTASVVTEMMTSKPKEEKKPPPDYKRRVLI